MGGALSWIAGGRAAPPKVPTDEVLPTYIFDDTSTLRDYTLMWTFRFDEVLDADKLNEALSRLFQREGWRRLGGRLRLRPDGRAEIHVPREFSADRPPVYFTKVHHEVRMADHPEASKLPEAADEPTTFPSGRAYAPLGVGPGAPRAIGDYFYSDAPLFALHVVTFTDGSLVSLTFNHTISDLSGLEAVLTAWQLTLAGRDDEVADFVGYREDPMEPLYKPGPVEKSVIDGSQLAGWRLIAWALRHVVETWWAPMESRMLCIPRRVIDAMVGQAQKDLGDDKLFVSENDVLVALSNRLLAQEQPHGRSIVTLMAVDPRTRVKSVFRSDAAYVGNAPSAAFFRCSAGDALGLPLGKLALRSREAISTQCTEEQLKAVAAFAYKSTIETGHPPLVGDASSMLLVVSSWSKAAFCKKVDFSPAIVRPSVASGPGQPGRPVHYYCESLTDGKFASTVVVVQGRDAHGHLWLSGGSTSKAWQGLLEHLKEYS